MFRSSIPIILAFMFTLAFSGVVEAQASRTWISGVGDDANPCSRTAPCKTFAGAITKTADKGEINCLDPGGFGGVTITKSITLDCKGFPGGVLAPGPLNGIVINGSGIVVTLRGLQIMGKTTGQNGVRLISAERVVIEDSVIDGFISHGIAVENALNTAVRVLVNRSSILHNTGPGIGGTPAGKAEIWVTDSLIAGNSAGLQAGSNVSIWLTGTSVTQNIDGLSVQKGGRILSFRNNAIGGNSTNGTPTGTAPLQ